MPGSGLSLRQLKLVTALAFCVSMLLVIFPRFATVITFGIFLGIVLLDPLVRYWRGLPQVEWIRFKTVEPFFWPFLLFWGWAALSLLWSANPAGGLSKVTLLGGLIIMCLGTGEGIRVADRRLLSAIVAGFVAGIAAVAIYIFFESVSARGLSRFLVKHMTYLAPLDHKHVQIQKNGTVMVSDANLNRSTAVFSLMLWPAVLGTLSFLPTWRRTLVNLVFFATGVALLIWSRHQSSQVALIASGLVFAAGLLYPFATRRVLAASWIAVLALVVPVSLLAFKHEFHLKPWLFDTARARVIIWDYTAERVLERPLIGVGADATPVIDEARVKEKVLPPGFVTPPETRAHPHNVYLHVWYELGLIGVAIFGWFGLLLIQSTRAYAERVQPYVLADLTLIGSIVASSYGFWQTWIQVAIAFSYLMINAAARARAEPD